MKRPRRPLLILLWFFIVLMIIAVVLFLMHKDRPFSDWTTDYWAFIISIFSAVFSGLNVLAFYHLTIAIEAQNSEREEKALRIEGLKYKLEQQQLVFDKVNAIRQAFASGERISKLTDAKDMASLDRIILTMNEEADMLQILKSCSTLFPSIRMNSVDAVSELYTEFKKKSEQELYRYLTSEKTEEDDTNSVEEYALSMAKLLMQNTNRMNAHLTLLIAQMRYDMQVALAQSIDQQAPEMPNWITEQALIYAIENKAQMMDSTRGAIKATPMFSPYRWDMTFFFEDEDENDD